MAKLISLLRNCCQSRLYWSGLILLGLALEAAALYYQYVLDEWPCVICIHIRIWIFGFILVAIVALFCVQSRTAMRVLHGLNLVMMLGFLERSYQVLAVERGWVFGDCDMELGMPAWFASGLRGLIPRVELPSIEGIVQPACSCAEASVSDSA